MKITEVLCKQKLDYSVGHDEWAYQQLVDSKHRHCNIIFPMPERSASELLFY